MKVYGGVGIQFRAFLTSALEGGEWSVSSPVGFTPREGAHVPTGQEVGWVPEPGRSRW